MKFSNLTHNDSTKLCCLVFSITKTNRWGFVLLQTLVSLSPLELSFEFVVVFFIFSLRICSVEEVKVEWELGLGHVRERLASSVAVVVYDIVIVLVCCCYVYICACVLYYVHICFVRVYSRIRVSLFFFLI